MKNICSCSPFSALIDCLYFIFIKLFIQPKDLFFRKLSLLISEHKKILYKHLINVFEVVYNLFHQYTMFALVTDCDLISSIMMKMLDNCIFII